MDTARSDVVRCVGILTKLWQRPALTQLFLRHHAGLFVRGVELIRVAAYSPGEDAAAGAFAQEALWHFVEAPNLPLTRKGNAACAVLRLYAPEVVVNLGSDDFISASFLETVRRLAETGTDYAIPSELFIWDLATARCVRVFNQYSLGAGRVFSRRLLALLSWQLWAAEGRPDRALDERLHNFYRHDKRIRSVLLPPGSGVVLCTIGPDSAFWTYERAREGLWREEIDGPAMVCEHFGEAFTDELLSFCDASVGAVSP